MIKPLIVITGKNGQLGWELMQLEAQLSNEFELLFTDRTQLDLSKPETIAVFFTKHKPSYFINCAAYTLVDKAETEKEIAMAVNAESVANIASECNSIGCVFITISTDYVFNGAGKNPYLPNQATEPVNYYGLTKQQGELKALENNAKTIIIRTAWVYSSHGNNFVKTMLRLMATRETISVVDDQIGSPTYAKDLANVLIKIVKQLEEGVQKFGIYHFTNSGTISWYNFACAIKDNAGLSCSVSPIPSTAFPTPAKRPSYSVLDTTSIQEDYQIQLELWQNSLAICMKDLGVMNA